MVARHGPPRMFAIVPLTILLLATANVSVPFLALAPGPAQDVKPLIAIDGTQTYPSGGELMLTTVSLRSVRVADAVVGWFDPTIAVVPRDDIIDPKQTDEEVDEENIQAMESSKQVATIAALHELNLQVRVAGDGARVEEVVPGAPADGVLRQGDVIVAINRARIATVSDLAGIVQARPAGTRFDVRVRRDGAEVVVKIRSAPAPDNGRPILGVSIVTDNERVELPFSVDIRSEGIGGPSAGLMFALAIVDLLDGPDDLANGAKVAGTGVITLDGTVDNVGAVAQKVAGAERAGAQVFLVPADELEEAQRVARKVKVVGVGTLKEAVAALRGMQRPVTAAPGS